jgi:hypothetical protein
MIKQNEIKMKLKSSSWPMYMEKICIIQIQRPSRAGALGPIFIIIFLKFINQIRAPGGHIQITIMIDTQQQYK